MVFLGDKRSKGTTAQVLHLVSRAWRHLAAAQGGSTPDCIKKQGMGGAPQGWGGRGPAVLVAGGTI